MDLAAIERSIRTADCCAILVDARLVRRVIKRHLGLPGLGVEVPHARCYALRREALCAIVRPAELGHTEASLAPDVILLPRPERPELARGAPAVLASLWRAAFHARVHVELGRRIEAGTLTAAMVRGRIHRLGQTEFDEVRLVLRSDDLLLPPYEDREAYVEFAATYLELRRFAPEALGRMFPTLDAFGDVDATIALDVDADRLLDACRPEGAADLARPERASLLAGSMRPPADADADEEPALPAPPPEVARRLTALADAARAKENLVRAALLGVASGASGLAAARADIDALVARLGRALAPGDAHYAASFDDAAWSAELWLLAQRAISLDGLFGRSEGRLLYDLQRACIAGEKATRAVDLVEWAIPFGRRPVVRPLPATREARIARYLRSAAGKLSSVHVPPASRARLVDLVRWARRRADENIRDALRPAIAEATFAVGLRPANVPEEVASRKVVEELLDQAVSHGFLGVGHLRDALSRNQLKMPDLEARELLWGDALLQADRRLARSLDGMYRRGEVYLRGLQKLSSLAFGTAPGRFLVRYLALPIGGAYVLLKAISLLIHEVAHLGHLHMRPLHIDTPVSHAVASVVLFGLMHVPPFRAAVVRGLRGLGWLLAGLLFRVPAWIASRAIVRAFFRSRPIRAAGRWVVKPGALAGVAYGTTPLHHAPPSIGLPITAAALVALSFALNSRVGALAEEVALDWTVRTWRRIRRRVLPGLVRLIGDFFHRMLGLLERGLYTVDEWLRFREGESRAALAVKAGLGVVWFVVAYLIRFFTNLMVEPTINPIKHFPVVTVAAKLLLTVTETLLRTVSEALSPIVGHFLAGTIAGSTVVFLPGFFGFLVWELKENWKLYRSARGDLRPIPIGHHGETMGALMKPGFHSGTLPKLYAKLRRAARDEDASMAGHSEALHEIEEAVERFVERELCAVLGASTGWKGGEVKVTHVALGSNRVKVEIEADRAAIGATGSYRAEPGGEHQGACCVAFEEQSGWIVARVARAGFVDGLSDADRATFENALAGLYQLAGVDLVHEQIDAALGGGAPAYDISEEGLVVWPDRAYGTEVVYDLDDRGRLAPVVRGEAPASAPPAIERADVLFRDQKIAWPAWVGAWSGAETVRVVTGPSLLPPRARALDDRASA